MLWLLVALVIFVPILVATQSSLLEWRQPIYVAAGFAGIIALALMLLQTLLVSGQLLVGSKQRYAHAIVGGSIVSLIVVHIGGLWYVSPPDVVDVLLFRSPTPFGLWGMIATLAVIASSGLAIFRTRISLTRFRALHGASAVLVVLTTIAHTILIEGAMGQNTKVALCIMVVGALFWTLWRRRSWRVFKLKRV